MISNSRSPNVISIFIPSFRGGGAERAMLLFANELYQRGYKVDLLVLTEEGPIRSLLNSEINIINFSARRAIFSLPKLIKYLKTKRPKALYATIIHLNLISVIANYLTGSKTQVFIRESNTPQHAFSSSKSGRIALKLLPIVYPYAHALIAVSDGVKTALINLAPKTEEKIHVIRTPVISEDFFLEAQKQAEVPLPARYILAAGRLHPQKDFKTLIEAFKIVLATKPELHLIILGEGRERPKLEQRIKALGIEKSVQLLGFLKNPFPVFKKAKLFVLSSKYEGMPNVLIQALALGVPCISTDCESGPREISDNGRLFPLIPIANVEEMAKKILENVDKALPEDTSKFISEIYSVKASADGYISLIK